MSMEFRYPDDPVRLPPHSHLFLGIEDDGEWLAQPKRNGWRRLAYKENGAWLFYSKEGIAKRDIPDDLRQKLNALPVPDGTALDTEWMGTRDVAFTGGRNWLEAFDVHYWGFQWQGNIPQEERLGSLGDLLAMCSVHAGDQDALILVPTWKTGIVGQFERLKSEYLAGKGEGTTSEGLVIKKRDARLAGGWTGVIENPAWAKVKYREG